MFLPVTSPVAYAFSSTLPVASKQDQPVLTRSQMASADLPLHMYACTHAPRTPVILEWWLWIIKMRRLLSLNNTTTVVPVSMGGLYSRLIAYENTSKVSCLHKNSYKSILHKQQYKLVSHSTHLQRNRARVVNILFQKTLTGGHYNESNYPMQELWR